MLDPDQDGTNDKLEWDNSRPPATKIGPVIILENPKAIEPKSVAQPCTGQKQKILFIIYLFIVEILVEILVKF